MKTKNKGPGTKLNKETRQSGPTDKKVNFRTKKKVKKMVLDYAKFKKLNDQEQKQLINESLFNILKYGHKLETTVQAFLEKKDADGFLNSHSIAEKINKENRNVVRLVRFYNLIQRNKK